MTASRTPLACRWRAADSANLRWFDSGNDYILYHRPSGKTHFLNDAGHALLVGAQGRALSLEEIRASIAGDVDTGELDAMLARFEELGLMIRVRNDDP